MRLMIYGAGGLGKEVFDIAETIQEVEGESEEIIFVVDEIFLNGQTKFYGAPLFSYESIKKTGNRKEDQFVIAVGEPDIREKLAEKLKADGFSLRSLIHPTAIISKTAIINDGVVICPQVMIASDVVIKENVYCQANSLVGHDTVIEENCVISSLVCIGGNCWIKKNTYIAIAVPVMQGLTIGSESIIGLGSVVTKDIEDSVIALGNPCAKKVKNRMKRVFIKINKEKLKS